MNALKLQLLDELLDHLAASQGGDLKSLLMEKPGDKPMTPLTDEPESPGVDGDPKGISIEKVSMLGKPTDGDEGDITAPGKPPGDDMSDDELEEMLKGLC